MNRRKFLSGVGAAASRTSDRVPAGPSACLNRPLSYRLTVCAAVVGPRLGAESLPEQVENRSGRVVHASPGVFLVAPHAGGSRRSVAGLGWGVAKW